MNTINLMNNTNTIERFKTSQAAESFLKLSMDSWKQLKAKCLYTQKEYIEKLIKEIDNQRADSNTVYAGYGQQVDDARERLIEIESWEREVVYFPAIESWAVVTTALIRGEEIII